MTTRFAFEPMNDQHVLVVGEYRRINEMLVVTLNDTGKRHALALTLAEELQCGKSKDIWRAVELMLDMLMEKVSLPFGPGQEWEERLGYLVDHAREFALVASLARRAGLADINPQVVEVLLMLHDEKGK